MRILLAILLLPLVDIASFVVVGPRLGVSGTLLLVLLSIVVGVSVLRRSGLRAVEQLRATLVEGRQAVPETIDAALMAVAGILLILPGFGSDILALLLLLPPIRDVITRQMMANFKRFGKVVVTTAGQGPQAPPHAPPGTKVIDVDYDDIDAPRR